MNTHRLTVLAMPLALLLGGGALAGCQQPGHCAKMSAAQALLAPGEQAVVCTSCGTSYVPDYRRASKGVLTFGRKAQTVCEGCTIASADARAGAVERTCTRCDSETGICRSCRQ